MIARGERGYTFIELLVVSAIVMLLASAVMPLARVTATRQREADLRRALREVRTAIDRYKDAADAQQIASLEIKVGSEGYPADLQVLVDGVAVQNDATGRKLKFLRRIPGRSDDALHRLGQAVISGRTRRVPLGRAERVRHLHEVRRDRT